MEADEFGRIDLSTILMGLGAIMLFAAMAVVGYTVTAPAETVPPSDASAELQAIPGASEVSEAAVREVVVSESLRTIRESGSFDDAAMERIAEEAGSGDGGSTTRALPADDPEPTVPVGAPATPAGSEPVPDEVFGDDDLIRSGIDWDSLDVVESIPDLRFDLCAGSTPGLPVLPWCPSGTGATIVPLDGGVGGEPLSNDYFVLAFPPPPYARIMHPSCDIADGVFRIVVITNRPSTFVVSAWNGTGGRPADAPTFEAATTLAEVADWEAANADDPGFGTRIAHCFELPSVTYGRVGWTVEGTSIYEPDDGAMDTDEDAVSWWNRTGGKPPSALVAATPRTLYVRAWNRSSASEQIFVQARPESMYGCDNRGDIAMVGSAPGSTQGILDQVIPIRGDLTGWPWSPAWDEIEIHRLTLAPGVPYDICIFWVGDGGPSFNPASVTRTETAQVVPPSPNNMTIEVVGGGFSEIEGDDPRINGIGVSAILSGPATFDPERPTNACRGAWDANSAAQTIDLRIGPSGATTLCTTDDVTSLILQGGMRVTTSATDSLGDTYRRSSWIVLPRSLFLCGAACGEEEMSVTVPLPWVAPRAITGHFDWPFDLETGAIVPIDDGETGQNGPPVGAIFLSLNFSPTGRESSHWYLGDIGDIDQSASRAPVRPQIDVTISQPRLDGANTQPGIYFPDGYPGLAHGIVEVRVEADRAVSVDAVVGPSDGDAMCLRSSTAPSYSSSARQRIHTFQLSGLCPLTDYVLSVEASDETGVTPEIFGIGPADGSTPMAFRTAPLVLTVEAQLAVEPAAYGPGDAGARLHISHYRDVWVGSPGWRTANVALSPVRSRTAEEAASGWTFDDPYGNVMCADPTPGGSFGAPMPLSGQTTYGTFFGDIADVELLAYRSSGPTRNDVRARGELLYRCSTPRSPVLYDLTARFDVVDLLNGVSIVSDDGLFTLEVRGRLAP